VYDFIVIIIIALENQQFKATFMILRSWHFPR